MKYNQQMNSQNYNPKEATLQQIKLTEEDVKMVLEDICLKQIGRNKYELIKKRCAKRAAKIIFKEIKRYGQLNVNEIVPAVSHIFKSFQFEKDFRVEILYYADRYLYGIENGSISIFDIMRDYVLSRKIEKINIEDLLMGDEPESESVIDLKKTSQPKWGKASHENFIRVYFDRFPGLKYKDAQKGTKFSRFCKHVSKSLARLGFHDSLDIISGLKKEPEKKLWSKEFIDNPERMFWWVKEFEKQKVSEPARFYYMFSDAQVERCLEMIKNENPNMDYAGLLEKYRLVGRRARMIKPLVFKKLFPKIPEKKLHLERNLEQIQIKSESESRQINQGRAEDLRNYKQEAEYKNIEPIG